MTAPALLPLVAALTSGHVDLDLDYTAGALSLSWRTDEDDDLPFADHPVSVPLASAYTVPGAASFACLGAPGTTVYRLKQAQDPTQVWLGYNTQDVPAGVFVGDKVQLQLVSVVSAPPGGRFVLYTTNALGTPAYLLNSTPGACGVAVFPGGGITARVHNHAWWAFSAPGTYTLRLAASGTLVPALGGATVTTGEVDVVFQVP